MRILIDLFPARARLVPSDSTDGVSLEEMTVTTRVPQSRAVDAVRVIVTTDNVLIAADTPRGVALIFREKYSSDTLELDRRGVSRLVTSTGKFVVFDKDNNCGCGSRLRGWNPYSNLDSSKDPGPDA